MNVLVARLILQVQARVFITGLTCKVRHRVHLSAGPLAYLMPCNKKTNVHKCGCFVTLPSDKVKASYLPGSFFLLYRQGVE